MSRYVDFQQNKVSMRVVNENLEMVDKFSIFSVVILNSIKMRVKSTQLYDFTCYEVNDDSSKKVVIETAEHIHLDVEKEDVKVGKNENMDMFSGGDFDQEQETSIKFQIFFKGNALQQKEK